MPAKKKETSSTSERKTAQAKKSALFTAEQLESMTTHELADMLSNIVMLLRRMPDVPCQELVAQASNTEHDADISPALSEHIPATISTTSTNEQENSTQNGQEASLQERIDAFMNDKKMTVPRLKSMADELGVPYPTKATKADLAKRVAERQMRGGHSEQYAIMNL